MKLTFDTGYGPMWVYDPKNKITYHVCIDKTVAIIGPLTPAEEAQEAMSALNLEEMLDEGEACCTD